MTAHYSQYLLLSLPRPDRRRKVHGRRRTTYSNLRHEDDVQSKESCGNQLPVVEVKNRNPLLLPHHRKLKISTCLFKSRQSFAIEQRCGLIPT